MARWGTRCAYCGRDLAETYETWLDLSVDHVVPANLIKYASYPVQWVEDLLNLRTCCRACNEFLNAFKVSDPAPQDLDDFACLVESVLKAKRLWVLERHGLERSRYQTWRDRLVGTGGPTSSH